MQFRKTALKIKRNKQKKTTLATDRLTGFTMGDRGGEDALRSR